MDLKRLRFPVRGADSRCWSHRSPVQRLIHAGAGRWAGLRGRRQLGAPCSVPRNSPGQCGAAHARQAQAEDEAAKKHGSRYTASQTAYLRSLLETIAAEPADEMGMAYLAEQDALYVTAQQATQAEVSAASCRLSSAPSLADHKARAQGPALPPLGMMDKEATLQRLVQDGWLHETELGYGVGVRRPLVHGCWPQPRLRGAPAQVRSFLELHGMLLDLDLPDATRQAWELFI